MSRLIHTHYKPLPPLSFLILPSYTPVDFLHLPDFTTFFSLLTSSFEYFSVLPHSTTMSPSPLSSIQRIRPTPSWKFPSLLLHYSTFLVICNPSLPPRACLNCSLNSMHHSFFFNFHHLIPSPVFTHFLFLISKVILQPPIRCL